MNAGNKSLSLLAPVRPLWEQRELRYGEEISARGRGKKFASFKFCWSFDESFVWLGIGLLERDYVNFDLPLHGYSSVEDSKLGVNPTVHPA